MDASLRPAISHDAESRVRALRSSDGCLSGGLLWVPCGRRQTNRVKVKDSAHNAAPEAIQGPFGNDTFFHDDRSARLLC